jgi:uncharacterized membrane protein YhhN
MVSVPILAPLIVLVMGFCLYRIGQFVQRKQTEARTILPYKMAASTGFLLLACAGMPWTTHFGIAVALGLFFSWWGDLFLALRAKTYFLLGVAAFALAHISYAAAFLLRPYGDGRTILERMSQDSRYVYDLPVAPIDTLGVFLLLCLIGAYVFVWVRRGAAGMRTAVAAYILIINAMVALAVGAYAAGASFLLPFAAVVFYVSDLFVARQHFRVPSPWNVWIGLPLYYTAQVAFALSVFTAAPSVPMIP